LVIVTPLAGRSPPVATGVVVAVVPPGPEMF
jgi:hypothetical protein